MTRTLALIINLHELPRSPAAPNKIHARRQPGNVDSFLAAFLGSEIHYL
ncbi:MAG: hypothetical protein ACM3U1_04200 [Chloroflexota bacterium]